MVHPAEARLSVEASDDSELRPPALSSSVGQRGRPRLPTHCKLQRPTEDHQLVFEALLAGWGPQIFAQ